MTDQYLPPLDQHDTAAYARPLPPEAQGPGGQQYGTAAPGGAGAGWQTPSQPLGINPEADYWASRYRSQRTWTRALAVGVAVALLGVLGIGIAVLRGDSTGTETASAGQPLADSAPGGTLPDAATPDGSGPGGSVPDGSGPGGSVPEGSRPDGSAPDSSDVPLSELPLPESVQDLARFLGITDVGQILDLAVANGMMSQEDADKLRAAIAVGSAIPGLLGDDQPQDGSGSDPASL